MKAVQFKFLCEVQTQIAGHPRKYQLANYVPGFGARA
jgi:hypothetical protein